MTWNPLALATALQTVPEQNIDVTNSENALIIKMNDYGDLQINILFTSRQMIIETFICPVSSISNPDEFNTFLLRNQKMMPLSSVGISSVQQEEYYIVFGALSLKEGANKRENSSRLTQSFHFFMFEPIFSPVNALNQPI